MSAQKAITEVSGEVIHGHNRGAAMGYPTANISVAAGQLPPLGIYAVRAKIEDGSWHPGAASFGKNPHFGDTGYSLEVHLFDFDQNIYGKTMTVQFVAFLREEQKFVNLDALLNQMEEDCHQARKILNLIDKNHTQK